MDPIHWNDARDRLDALLAEFIARGIATPYTHELPGCDEDFRLVDKPPNLASALLLIMKLIKERSIQRLLQDFWATPAGAAFQPGRSMVPTVRAHPLPPS